MNCTTYLSTTEKHDISQNKELLDLLNSHPILQTLYVVKERDIILTKRKFLIFDVEQYHFVYDIYYRYQGETSSNVKKVILENPYGESTYSYFLGVLNTLDKTESD